MADWIAQAAETLWRNGIAVVPMAALVAACTRWFPTRPASRHLLWLTLLLWPLAPPLWPSLSSIEFGTPVLDGVVVASPGQGRAIIDGSSDGPAQSVIRDVAIDWPIDRMMTDPSSVFRPDPPRPLAPFGRPIDGHVERISPIPADRVERGAAAHELPTVPSVDRAVRMLARADDVPRPPAGKLHTERLAEPEGCAANGTSAARPMPAVALPDRTKLLPAMPRVRERLRIVVGGGAARTGGPGAIDDNVERKPLAVAAVGGIRIDRRRRPSPQAGGSIKRPRPELDNHATIQPPVSAVNPTSVSQATVQGRPSPREIPPQWRPGDITPAMPDGGGNVSRGWQAWLSAVLSARDAVASIPPLLMGLWLGGAFAVVLVVVVRIVLFLGRVRQSRPADRAVRRLVVEAARQVGLRRVPSVWMVDAQMSPMIWSGWAGACLLLPAGLWAELDTTGRRVVVYHELAHLRRRDHWVSWADLLVGIIFWWHPVVWWVRSKLRNEAENCCDAWVTTLIPRGRRAYAEALLKTREQLAHGHRWMPGLGMGVTTGRAKRFARRLTMVMTGSARPRISASGVVLAVALANIGWLTAPVRSCPREDKTERVKGAHEEESSEGSSYEIYLAGKAAGQSQEGQSVEPGGLPTAVVPETFALIRSGLTARLVNDDGDDDDDQDGRIDELENRLDKLTQQLDRLTDALERRMDGHDRRKGKKARKHKTYRRSEHGHAHVPAPPGPPAAPAPHGPTALPKPGQLWRDVTPSEVNWRTYRLSNEGKLGLFTSLMVRDDVPILVSPQDHAIRIQASKRQHGVITAFLQIIDPSSERDDAGFPFDHHVAPGFSETGGCGHGGEARRCGSCVSSAPCKQCATGGASSCGKDRCDRCKKCPCSTCLRAKHHKKRAQSLRSRADEALTRIRTRSKGEVERVRARAREEARRVRSRLRDHARGARAEAESESEAIDAIERQAEALHRQAEGLRDSADSIRERRDELHARVTEIEDQAGHELAFEQHRRRLDDSTRAMEEQARVLSEEAEVLMESARVMEQEIERLEGHARSLDERAEAIDDAAAALDDDDVNPDVAQALLALMTDLQKPEESDDTPIGGTFDMGKAFEAATAVLSVDPTTLFGSMAAAMEREEKVGALVDTPLPATPETASVGSATAGVGDGAEE